MSDLYTVTAGNRFFYMDLAVRAESRDAAEVAFRAHLAESRSQEEYEYKRALEGPEDQQDFNRYDYSYDFDTATIERDGSLGNYTGTVGDEVVMLRSGGNG